MILLRLVSLYRYKKYKRKSSIIKISYNLYIFKLFNLYIKKVKKKKSEMDFKYHIKIIYLF